MCHLSDDICRKDSLYLHSIIAKHLFAINESTIKLITSKFQCVNRHLYSQTQSLLLNHEFSIHVAAFSH